MVVLRASSTGAVMTRDNECHDTILPYNNGKSGVHALLQSHHVIVIRAEIACQLYFQ